MVGGRRLAVVLLGIALLSACAAQQTEEPAAMSPSTLASTESTAEPAAPPPSATADPEPTTAAPPPPPVASSWVMPNLAGQGLQDAQDANQSLT